MYLGENTLEQDNRGNDFISWGFPFITLCDCSPSLKHNSFSSARTVWGRERSRIKVFIVTSTSYTLVASFHQVNVSWGIGSGHSGSHTNPNSRQKGCFSWYSVWCTAMWNRNHYSLQWPPPPPSRPHTPPSHSKGCWWLKSSQGL